jgi:hypothetical protein
MSMSAAPPVFHASNNAETALNVVFGLAALITAAYCLNVARRRHALWALFVLGGAGLTVIYEPINNVLGHCFYPVNQDTLITEFGRHIPYYIGFVYVFYFGIPVTWLMQRFEAGITSRQLTKYFSVAVVLCAAFEPYFTHKMLWYYYGPNQALDFTGLPMFWWFANPMCIFATAAIFHGLRRQVFTRPAQSALFLPLLPLAVFASHGSASVPVFIAINGDGGQGWVTVATLATIALALTYLWVIARTVCIRPGAGPAVNARSGANAQRPYTKTLAVDVRS